MERVYKKELLDDLSVPFEEIRLNMQELDFINTWLGGHDITVSGIRKLATGLNTSTKEPVSILEIGCGGGDNLRAIKKWADKKNRRVELCGIDYNPNCIAFAKQVFPQARYIESDYREAKLDKKPHIIFSSLFCHHFDEAELVDQLRWMYENSQTGFMINDLHRHRLAYWSIRALTRIFSQSRLVRHDAPLSVQRGFTRGEWYRLMAAAGIPDAEISWRWAFRWLVLVKK